jgi:hypothetical protein
LEQLGQLLNLKNAKFAKRITLLTSKFAIDLNPGSKQNMKFLELLRDTHNKEVFRGSLKELVDLKWQQMKKLVVIHSMIYFVNALLVGLNLIIPNSLG